MCLSESILKDVRTLTNGYYVIGYNSLGLQMSSKSGVIKIVII